MLKASALLVTAILVLCDSSPIIDTDKRCSSTDEKCLRVLAELIFKKVSDGGTVGIPKLDPMMIQDFHVQLVGMLDITVTDGTLKGFKTCYFKTFKNNLQTGHSQIEVICDLITFEGSYITKSTPALLVLTSGINIHGKGKGSAVIEKLKMNVDVAYDLKKHDDGKKYFNIKPEESSYTFEVLGKVTVGGDNFFVGKQDISTVATNIVNENWKIFINSFGKIFLDKGFIYICDWSQKILDYYSADEFLTDV